MYKRQIVHSASSGAITEYIGNLRMRGRHTETCQVHFIAFRDAVAMVSISLFVMTMDWKLFKMCIRDRDRGYPFHISELVEKTVLCVGEQ